MMIEENNHQVFHNFLQNHMFMFLFKNFTEFYLTNLNRQFTYLSRIFTGKKFNFYYLLAILLFIKFLLFFNKYFTGKNKKNTGTFINCL